MDANNIPTTYATRSDLIKVLDVWGITYAMHGPRIRFWSDDESLGAESSPSPNGTIRFAWVDDDFTDSLSGYASIDGTIRQIIRRNNM